MLEVKGRSNLRMSVSVVATEDSWFCVTARAALKLTTCPAWIEPRDHLVSHVSTVLLLNVTVVLSFSNVKTELFFLIGDPVIKY